MGRRSVVVDHLFSVKLQGRGLAYAPGAPARGAPLAWVRVRVIFFTIIYRVIPRFIISMFTGCVNLH